MTTTAPLGRWTYVGLALALLGIPVITTLHRTLAADPMAGGSIIVRELAILALVGVILWLVKAKEGLPLTSIGIRPTGIIKSLGWGVLLAVACLAAALACLTAFGALGISYGSESGIARSLPVVILTVLRAGIAEEVFFRGYALERLETMTGSKWIAAGVTLLLFTAFHYRQGPAGLVLVFIIAAVLTVFYLWKRDLVANMFGHFLVDFIPNVLLAPPA